MQSISHSSPINHEVLLALQGVSFGYGQKLIIQGLDWFLHQGSFECVIGRSGCGKSTLLELLCGLKRPQMGEVYLCGKRHQGPQQDISYVFQKPNLLDWLNVLDNVLLPHKLKSKVDKITVDRAMSILNLLGISSQAHQPIWRLSGGEQSRVAIARALVAKPRVLLMDEPFASLDAITREELQAQLRLLHVQLGLTTVFVTHDLQEAIYLGDLVHVLEQGQFVHSQNIDFSSSRAPNLKDESQFVNYSNILRNALGKSVDEQKFQLFSGVSDAL
jgi:NitT/TauT family transport system ATP-binding protein